MDPLGTPEIAAQPDAKRLVRRWPLVSAIVALLLTFCFGTLIVLRDDKMPLSIDTQWVAVLDEHRTPIWEGLSLSMNYLGGGWVATFLVPVLIMIALLLVKRPWAAGYYIVATMLSAGIVQLLKQLFGRARPEDILGNVSVDFGSFPSGHVANAATMAAILAILFPHLWVWITGALYTIVMMFSRTYLGAHWLTDTIGGLLFGVGVAIVVWALLAAKLDREHEVAPRHPSPFTIRRRNAAKSD